MATRPRRRGSATSTGGTGRPRRLLGDAGFRAFGAAWLVIVAPYALYSTGGSLPAAYRESWAFVLAAGAVAAAVLGDLGRCRDGGERRVRLLVGMAFAVWGIEELLELRFDSASFYVLHDGLFVLFYLLLGFVAFAGARFEDARQSATLRRLARYETALFAIGMFFYFVLAPMRMGPDPGPRGLTSATLYLMLDAFLAGLFGWRLHRAARGRDRRRWQWMAIASLLFLGTDLLFYFGQRSLVPLDRWPALDVLWFLPHLAVVAAVRTPATGTASSGVVSPLDHEVATLRFAPGFLYAALVPAIHLVSELAAAESATELTRAQGIFALVLAALLLLFAGIHQRRISELQQALRAELVESRRQLANAVKLDAIGRLAAGVAHDFNNLLTVVVGRTDLMLARSESAAMRENLEMVLRAARRAADLTSELLAVGQRQIGFRSRVELGGQLHELLPELRELCGEGVELRVTLAERPLEIAIDPLHLERIVRNLVANARDAMPDGGVLELTTGARSGGAPGREAERAWGRDGEWAELVVRDSGVGMDEETQKRLFEPFFTTKAMGRGTGLGLATVYGLVHQNEGAIDVESSPGDGTRIAIGFPLLAAADTDGAEPAEPASLDAAAGARR